MNELSQLDELKESDILEALGGEVSEDVAEGHSPLEDEIKIEDFNETEEEKEVFIEETHEAKESIESSEKNQTISEKNLTTTLNTNDLTSLLSQLLNNKTIEITIKIKD
ncbi:MAG: hypothetical protein CSA86_01315 [Arcobacter sp.]|nr:MAG: hypothetical protein CSA86_01315 [Arcobacter sp.]